MKNNWLLLCFLGLCSCKKHTVLELPEHLIGFEINNECIDASDLEDWKRKPDKIYSYYKKNGARVKDGEEIIFLDGDTIISNKYRNGILVLSNRFTSIHN